MTDPAPSYTANLGAGDINANRARWQLGAGKTTPALALPAEWFEDNTAGFLRRFAIRSDGGLDLHFASDDTTPSQTADKNLHADIPPLLRIAWAAGSTYDQSYFGETAPRSFVCDGIAGDETEPYRVYPVAVMPANGSADVGRRFSVIIVDTSIARAATLTLSLTGKLPPRGPAVEPGTVSTGAPSATLSATPAEDPVEAQPGTVSAGAPSATLSATPAEDPVEAQPGAVSAGAPAAQLSASADQGDPVEAQLGAVSAGAPTAAISPAPSDPFPQDVRPGTVAAGAPEAALSATPAEDPVDARIAAASGAPSARLSAGPWGQVEVRFGAVSAAAPTARAAISRGDAAPVAVEPGPVSAGAPTAALSAAPAAAPPVDAVLGRGSVGAPTAALSAAVGVVGAEFIATELAIAPARRILTCIEIGHPAAVAPLRLVNDGRPATVDGETYHASRFDSKVVSDVDRKAPRGQIVIGNVGRAASRWVDAVDGAAGGTVRVFEILEGTEEPDWEIEMDMAGISAQENVVITLGFDPLLGRPAVALRYDPQTAPGLFVG